MGIFMLFNIFSASRFVLESMTIISVFLGENFKETDKISKHFFNIKALFLVQIAIVIIQTELFF